MAHAVYTQGENHILQIYFQGVPFTGPFYIGLGTGAMPTIEGSTLANITEVIGTNYARQSINRDATAYGWSIVDDIAQAAEISFKNLDLSICWTEADYCFLTLSPSGVTAPNILIAAIELTQTIILEPQQKMKLIFKFQQI